MPIDLNDFSALNHEIMKNRENLNKAISLSEQGMENLSAALDAYGEAPRSIPCRDILIQTYARLDRFDEARDVAERAENAGSYRPGRKQAVLARIDALEQASDRLHACVYDNPGLREDQAMALLTDCDQKALEWYITHTTTIKKQPAQHTYRLRLPFHDETRNSIKAAVVDVETTGMSHTKDEIVEIGVMLCNVDSDSGELLEVLKEENELNQPSFPIPPFVSRIHGITDKEVDGKIMDYSKLEQLFQEADLLIAHNAPFDRGFIQRYFPSTKRMIWHCSIKGINWKQYGFPTRKLLDLCRYHNITEHQNHRALDDVKLTVQLLQQQTPTGDYYLKELLAAT
ncbi:exonuclease domain-containing protein [Salibacterium salarium]|nr:exonuclease domain-containing protein [Salibacterium salarium]